MTPERKKNRLRLALIAVLVGFWVFVLAGSEGVVWWFWLVPIPLLLIVYEIALRGSRCSHCGRDYGLEEISRTPGGVWGGGRVHLVCVSCGQQETHRVGTGH